MGCASTVLDNFGFIDDDMKKEFLRSIYNDAGSLNAMVENILSMTRFDEGKIRLKLAEEAAEEIAAEAIESVRKRATGHIIKAEIPSEMIFMKVDGVLIKQLLVNLLDNAVNYTPRGSEITVSLYRSGVGIFFEVRDDGPGISDEDKPHIFERFFTKHDNAYGARRGTGLGLSICKSIVDIHGGTICVEDNEPHGTVIRFFIPTEEVESNAADDIGS
jgi:two-component system sensor histidine kinase KdpD